MEWECTGEDWEGGGGESDKGKTKTHSVSPGPKSQGRAGNAREDLIILPLPGTDLSVDTPWFSSSLHRSTGTRACYRTSHV